RAREVFVADAFAQLNLLDGVLQLRPTRVAIAFRELELCAVEGLESLAFSKLFRLFAELFEIRPLRQRPGAGAHGKPPCHSRRSAYRRHVGSCRQALMLRRWAQPFPRARARSPRVQGL